MQKWSACTIKVIERTFCLFRKKLKLKITINSENTDFICLFFGLKIIYRCQAVPHVLAFVIYKGKDLLTIHINILISRGSSLHWFISKRHVLHIYDLVSGVFEWLDNSTEQWMQSSLWLFWRSVGWIWWCRKRKNKSRHLLTHRRIFKHINKNGQYFDDVLHLTVE